MGEMTRADALVSQQCGVVKANEDCPRCDEPMVRHAMGVECLNPACRYTRDGHISHDQLQQADGWRIFDKDE